jgi:ABC-2 type transport system ATP-binding protein
MNSPLIAQNLTKSFEGRAVLKSLSLEIPAGRVAGLLGRNGAGKTTFLNLACGLLLPTSGSCLTLGRSAGELDSLELNQLGVVFQEGQFLSWMTVAQQLAFHASFYGNWDRTREARLLRELELDPTREIAELSTGDRQKLGIILAVCHHPSLLLLDEPVSSLDPIVRSRLLSFLVDLVREDNCTVAISSHILGDVERIIDWVVCLDQGELTTSAALDEIQESYAEWIVSSASGNLPACFSDPWVLTHEGDARRARLVVRRPAESVASQFAATHGATIERRSLSLDQLFPFLIGKQETAA